MPEITGVILNNTRTQTEAIANYPYYHYKYKYYQSENPQKKGQREKNIKGYSLAKIRLFKETRAQSTPQLHSR